MTIHGVDVVSARPVRDRRIQVKLSADELVLVKQLADRVDLDVSHYIRRLIRVKGAKMRGSSGQPAES